ncbi:MAG TPA: HAMP domain-containing protein, partial [Kofleriaceae bacterium]|nr:HAMP domain-containing protein [Kofleriaceae bacterium]
SVPVRVTVVDPRGRVLGDSAAQAGGPELENHIQRPEIAQALREANGAAIRRSATTGQTMIYAAQRFPDRGPPRGIVRLAVPTSRADQAAADVLSFLDQAGAAALSLALILSLIAAILVSRPLRRIAHGARALAAGDLGHVVSVRSRDELGEVALALEELAAQLRVRLLESGADHMTLRALLDDLPVGAILYGRDQVPQVINGAARALLELSSASEVEDARRLIEQPEQAQLVARVLDSRLGQEQALVVPWQGKARLRGRWIAVAQPDGGAQPALLLWRDEEADQRAMAQAVVRWADLMRQVLPELREPAMAKKLAHALVEMDRSRAAELPRPDQIECVKLAELCDLPMRAAQARAGNDVGIAIDLPEPDALVVESGGRVEAALRRLLSDAIGASEPGATLRLRGEPDRTHVRLSVRVRGGAPVKTKWLANQVACLGGEAGAVRDGDELEVWLTLPRG